jgi:hypothetical protein
VALTLLQRRRTSRNKKETLGIHPRVSIAVSLYPSLFNCAFYFVIPFMLEVIYLSIIELLVLLSISCWCT